MWRVFIISEDSRWRAAGQGARAGYQGTALPLDRAKATRCYRNEGKRPASGLNATKPVKHKGEAPMAGRILHTTKREPLIVNPVDAAGASILIARR